MKRKSYISKLSSYFTEGSIDRPTKIRLTFSVEGAFMEEATLDHGLDRLPFLSLPFPLHFFTALLVFCFSFFFAPSVVFATTFGPISLSDQINSTQYMLHGRIVGNSWVVENRENRRPYTHWKLQVITQPKGENLGKEVILRQPGGELGEMGYHVAGTATFRAGEEVFVNVRDTEDPQAKEVLGMASGKYTVERSESGKPQLRSGLGFLLKDEEGNPYTVDSFLAYTERILAGKATEGDKSVMVTKGTSDHGPSHFQVVLPKPGQKPLPPKPEVQPQPQKLESAVETDSKSSEELNSSSGISWWWSLIVFPIFGGFFWFLRRD